ncbi:hypothetical protein DRN43_06200 [Thermococci archaeon]|nr:MAG: hypothetical protein DRN43_06200 [Thermococci archaeon]
MKALINYVMEKPKSGRHIPQISRGSFDMAVLTREREQDILVNNAGVYWFRDFTEVDEKFEKIGISFHFNFQWGALGSPMRLHV